MFAEDPEPNAQRLLTRSTVLARAIADAGVDHDCIAHGDMVDVVADLVDDAGAVRAKHPWRRDRDTG